jgi:hypothetical protein
VRRRDICAHCGTAYAALRVGLTFGAVRAELRAEPERRRVTRHTVLGRMREHKLNLWNMTHGIERCAPDPDRPADAGTTTTDDRSTPLW